VPLGLHVAPEHDPEQPHLRHAPRRVDRQGRIYAAPEATKVVAATYPAPVRAWIARHGGLTKRLILLRGRELAAIYPRCS